MTTTDPFDVLRVHLRAQLVADPVTTPEDLVESIVSGRVRAPRWTPQRQARRRRGWGMGLGAVIVVGGGLTAAAVIRQDTVSQPQAGVLCRTSVDRDANAYEVGVQDDPVAACRALWDDGTMLEVRDGSVDAVPDAPAPPLVACIGAGGLVEVYPAAIGDPCVALDLAPLGATVAAQDPLVALRDRIAEEVHLRCVDVDDAADAVSTMLGDLGLGEWRVEVGRDREHEPCAIAGIVPQERTVHVVHHPGPPPATAPASDAPSS